MQSVEPKITKDVYDYLSPKCSVDQKKSFGGTATSQVKAAITRAKKKLKI